MVKSIFSSQIWVCFVSNMYSVCSENFFEVHYISVGQKLAKLKICLTSFTFLSLRNLEAAPEEAMHLRRLIKSSNESLVGPYLFGKFNFWNFQGPRAEIPRGVRTDPPPPTPGCYSTSKSPGLIGLKEKFPAIHQAQHDLSFRAGRSYVIKR